MHESITHTGGAPLEAAVMAAIAAVANALRRHALALFAAYTAQSDRTAADPNARPYSESHETCRPCAYVRWIQAVAAFDAGGRPAVIRLLRKREPFTAHVCRGGVPRTAARASLYRAIAKNGNLEDIPLPGTAIHQTIRRRTDHAGFNHAAISKLGGHSMRAGFVTQGTRNGADGSTITRQTGHAILDSVEVCRHEHAPLVGNAVNEIGVSLPRSSTPAIGRILPILCCCWPPALE